MSLRISRGRGDGSCAAGSRRHTGGGNSSETESQWPARLTVRSSSWSMLPARRRSRRRGSPCSFPRRCRCGWDSAWCRSAVAEGPDPSRRHVGGQVLEATVSGAAAGGRAGEVGGRSGHGRRRRHRQRRALGIAEGRAAIARRGRRERDGEVGAGCIHRCGIRGTCYRRGGESSCPPRRQTRTRRRCDRCGSRWPARRARSCRRRRRCSGWERPRSPTGYAEPEPPA